MPTGPTPALPPCASSSHRPFPHLRLQTLRQFHRMATDPSRPGAGDGTPGENPPPSSPRKSSSASDTSSPEFEFWKARNEARAVPEPALLSADELFADGVVLPLRLLRDSGTTHLRAAASEEAAGSVTEVPEPPPPPVSRADQPLPSTSSKRWKDIISFRRGGEKKSEVAAAEEPERDGDRLMMMGKSRKKRLERKGGSAGGAVAADLNINIWPFARSRSAGTGAASRPRAAAPGGPPRKSSSAPCSRSNSAGESKSKKWPASPGRTPLAAGVHLGRSSPVWQIRRVGHGAKPGTDSGSRTSRRGTTDAAGVTGNSHNHNHNHSSSSKGRVLNLNVPLCIGYRHNLSCSSDNDGAAVAQAGGRLNAGATGAGNGNGNGGNGSLFNFRSLFSKKVY